MIISPKHKFVFISNPKTGSATITRTLLNHIKDENLIDEWDFNSGCGFGKHTSCSDLIEQRPEYKNYFKFAFVRNPWHRVLSWYYFSKKSKKLKRNTSNISFDEFIRDNKFRYRIWGNRNQTQYIFTQGCDFIGRTENLQSDFNKVCDKVGIPQQELPHLNKTKHKHYTEYYNDETIKIVAEIFAKDIEYFNYEFGK